MLTTTPPKVHGVDWYIYSLDEMQTQWNLGQKEWWSMGEAFVQQLFEVDWSESLVTGKKGVQKCLLAGLILVKTGTCQSVLSLRNGCSYHKHMLLLMLLNLYIFKLNVVHSHKVCLGDRNYFSFREFWTNLIPSAKKYMFPFATSYHLWVLQNCSSRCPSDSGYTAWHHVFQILLHSNHTMTTPYSVKIPKTLPSSTLSIVP